MDVIVAMGMAAIASRVRVTVGSVSGRIIAVGRGHGSKGMGNMRVRVVGVQPQGLLFTARLVARGKSKGTG